MTGEEKNTFFRNLRADLPMYISVDKDVLCTADASTTWSQGDMSLEKLQKFLGNRAATTADFGNGYLWRM